MATPRSTDSGEAARQSALEQITFRFCAECSNMLYPKEDEESHKLQYTCRTCQYTEEAATSCVFRDVMNNAAGETAGVTQDVGSDPTVGTSKSSCVKSPKPSLCPHGTGKSQGPNKPTCVSFDSAPSDPSNTTPKDTDDTDIATCLVCGYTLLHCSECNEPATISDYTEFCYRDGSEFAYAKEDNWKELSEYFNTLNEKQQGQWVDNLINGNCRQSDPEECPISSLLNQFPDDASGNFYDTEKLES